MKGQRILQTVRRYWQAQRAFSYASRKGLMGSDFGKFGKHLGWSLILKGNKRGITKLLVPVHSTRYFEFDFVRTHLSESAVRCLDVSSPFLFALHAAANSTGKKVLMTNPDLEDVTFIEQSIKALDLTNCHIEPLPLHKVPQQREGYECIWSISVIEHIEGAYDDRQSMQMLYDLLSPGGRLIVTVPVDRQFWIEYRDVSHYGTQPRQGDRYFFQRFYDWNGIRERLLDPIGCAPTVISWFGEIEKGHFHRYTQRWQKEGLDCIVEDPRDIVDHYSTYDSWDSMPGAGVCGLVIDKPQ